MISVRPSQWSGLSTRLAFVFALSLESAAFAADKIACATAAEEGQQLRASQKVLEARKRFLICARADCPPAVSQDCVKWLSETDSAIATLTVKPADPDGKTLVDVRVTLDGSVLSERGMPGPVDVEPGHHVVRCEHAGFVASETSVDVAGGEKRDVDVKLSLPVVVEPAPKKPGWTVPVPSLILGGVGVLGFAGFGILGAVGLSEQDNLRKTCAPNCTSKELRALNAEFAIADVSLVVGITALTAAVVIAIVWPSRAPKAAWLSPVGLRW